jgi:hypothetical protein
MQEIFGSKGTSQSRQNLGWTRGEGDQYQMRVREPIGEEGVCHSLASRKRIARVRE